MSFPIENSPRRPSLGLFEKFGIELEYMIVRNDTGQVAPVADRIMTALCGETASDATVGACEVSNELAAHVFELKTPSPTSDLEQLEVDLAEAIGLTNEILAGHDCRLLPGPMHPTMDPVVESATWPHGNRDVYELYDSIFNCRGHGWFNLQSCHINLPFCGDDEFARLHSAILLVLPVLPALTAASPFREGQVTGFLDTRIETYRTNQSRCPLIAGDIIPEAIFSQQEYHDKILAPMFRQIRPLDPDGILQHEWLNSRGAIARFDRNAIEIRLLDVQECPRADLALARLIIETIRYLVDQRPRDLRTWAGASSAAARKEQLLLVIRDGFDAPLVLPEIGPAFHLPAACQTVGAFWRYLFAALPRTGFSARDEETIAAILAQGNLATRLLALHRRRPDDFGSVIKELGDCLAQNRLLTVD
jgi:glutamate---cysteine ligase / carboxylate-amine ligase